MTQKPEPLLVGFHQEVRAAPLSFTGHRESSVCEKHLNTQIHHIVHTSSQHHSEKNSSGPTTRSRNGNWTSGWDLYTLFFSFKSSPKLLQVQHFRNFFSAWSTAMFSSVQKQKRGGEMENKSVFEKCGILFLSRHLYLPKILSYSSSISSTIWFW